MISIERPTQSWHDMGEIVLAKNRINDDEEVVRYTTKMKFGKENQNGWYSNRKLSFNYSFGESYDNPKHVNKPYRLYRLQERIDEKIEVAKRKNLQTGLSSTKKLLNRCF